MCKIKKDVAALTSDEQLQLVGLKKRDYVRSDKAHAVGVGVISSRFQSNSSLPVCPFLSVGWKFGAMRWSDGDVWSCIRAVKGSARLIRLAPFLAGSIMRYAIYESCTVDAPP